jgi:uncharacterized coiled-coil DUF342 family protein
MHLDADRVRQEILKYTTEIRDLDHYIANEHNKHTSLQAKIRDIVSEIRGKLANFEPKSQLTSDYFSY